MTKLEATRAALIEVIVENLRFEHTPNRRTPTQAQYTRANALADALIEQIKAGIHTMGLERRKK